MSVTASSNKTTSHPIRDVGNNELALSLPKDKLTQILNQSGCRQVLTRKKGNEDLILYSRPGLGKDDPPEYFLRVPGRQQLFGDPPDDKIYGVKLNNGTITNVYEAVETDTDTTFRLENYYNKEIKNSPYKNFKFDGLLGKSSGTDRLDTQQCNEVKNFNNPNNAYDLANVRGLLGTLSKVLKNKNLSPTQFGGGPVDSGTLKALGAFRAEALSVANNTPTSFSAEYAVIGLNDPNDGLSDEGTRNYQIVDKGLKSLQTLIGVEPDGKFGRASIAALDNWLQNTENCSKGGGTGLRTIIPTN